jgi:cell division transport system permease protein
MQVRIWAQYFKQAFTSLIGNRLVHAISVGTISISLLLLGAFVLLFVNINTWVMAWGKSLTMSIYLEHDIDQKRMRAIESALVKLPGAELKEFVSKDKAMRDLIVTLGPQSGLIEGLSTNPLPASFEVLFKDVDKHQLDPKAIKRSLEALGGVDEVQYSEQWLERFEGLIYMLKVAGLIMGGLLCIAVLFIMTNTIKLTIYSRRDEIEIYKLVGATDWFLKIPFLIEGAVQGLIGALIALLILFLTYLLFSEKTLYVFGLPLTQTIIFLPKGHTLLLLSLGLVLGLMGSFIAVGRFIEFADELY